MMKLTTKADRVAYQIIADSCATVDFYLVSSIAANRTLATVINKACGNCRLNFLKLIKSKKIGKVLA